MSENGTDPTGWFARLSDGGGGSDADGTVTEDPDDVTVDAARRAIDSGGDDQPADWPALAVAAGLVGSEAEYYDLLHRVTVMAARAAVKEAERADDRQLIHSVRAMDDAERIANELAERAAEWAGSLFEDTSPGIDGARAVAARTPDGPAEARVVSLAERVVALADERDELRAYVETAAPVVAPNLSDLAGPVLAARLIGLAGGLESLAKKPSGTVQVLGAEDALFAHLRGHAPSPKHGIIYTHEYVNGTRPADRGSAARAVAGKLTLAARVDYYSGERKPELKEALDDRIETIRARAGDGTDDEPPTPGEEDPS